MKARAWLFAAAMSVSGLVLAQTATQSGVVEITDPAKIAEIERHAQQLASGAPTTPMAGDHMQQHGERHQMRNHGRRHHMHKHGKRHRQHRAMHHRGMKDKAPSDTPMATESKG